MAVKVLVVDNNPVFLKAVATMLEQEGCRVQCAGTGLEALQLLAGFEAEMVVTDLIMPSVSGEQLCRILRQTPKYRDVFLVVLSAIIAEDQERIRRDTSCDLCIAKGSLKELRQHLREALRLYRERRGTANFPERRQDWRLADGVKPLAVTSELLSEKRHLNAILANLDEGIVELSRDGKIIAANPAALKMLGVGEEVLIGAGAEGAIDWGELSSQISGWLKEHLLLGRKGQFFLTEERPLRVNGRVIVGSLVVVAEGDDFFGLIFLLDITRQHLAEEHGKAFDDAIRLVKKMDAMSIMAGGVAHDFNNLLTVICGNLDILALYGRQQGEGERARLLDQARKAALVAVDLTRQISCFSNLGIVNREMTDINPIVRQAVREFFGDGEGYTLAIAEASVRVCVDAVEIRQAIANVLRNAVEAGGRHPIEIALRRTVVAEPCLLAGQYLSAGSYATIDIRDYGRGIDPQQLFRVFDPYYSTKERGASKGMGLGLTVVYATFRNHGGHVVLHSQPRQGTTVSLYLPIIEARQDPVSPFEAGGEERRRVILCEPDARMGEIGRIMLEHLGFSVVFVTDHRQVLEEARRHLVDPRQLRPLVLLDLGTTAGQMAVETCRQLHQIDPDLAVIAMSGSILDPVMNDCRRHGFVNTLAKPYTIDSLRHVTTMIDGR